ncbi:MAG: UDP-N-acetylmuramoyl-L-alanine--D-glutamate ligase [Gammaproteobacteria bacterium]
MEGTIVMGLGATGMSCVRHLRARGEPVIVLDSRPEPPLLDACKREHPEVEVRTGHFDRRFLAKATRIVVSPGLVGDCVVEELRRSGAALTSDLDLFVEAAKAPIVGITGTNGKSTVTAMTAFMLARAGKGAVAGGNIGRPMLELLGEEAEYYVLELSSFQLALTRLLRCEVATFLIVSHDHTDRHGTYDAYTIAKRRIYDGARQRVFNRADELTWPEGDGACISFGLDAPAAGNFGLIAHDGETWLAQGDQGLVAASELPLRGRHNLENALASLALGSSVGADVDAMSKSLAAFEGLPHRCELVAEIDGVEYLNDSKATNVGACAAALAGIGSGARTVLLIAGGQGKGADFSPLRDVVGREVRTLLLIGEDADRLESALGDVVPTLRCRDLPDALERARAIAERGDTVLLSPACASFDMFDNFEQRGERFRALVLGRDEEGAR